MINSLKKYMVVDLIILTIIGAILEFLCIKFGGLVFFASPTAIFGLLIVFIAVARWNLWGLVVAPVMAIVGFLGGMTIEIQTLKAVYNFSTNWMLLISTMLGYVAFGINVIFFKKFTTAKTLNSNYKIVGLTILDYLVFCGIQTLIYFLLTKVVCDGMIAYTYFDSTKADYVTCNLCQYGMSSAGYNLFGLAILAVGAVILRYQGVICNVKQKLIDDKENAKLMEQDRNFRISEEDFASNQGSETDAPSTSEEKSEDDVESSK